MNNTMRTKEIAKNEKKEKQRKKTKSLQWNSVSSWLSNTIYKWWGKLNRLFVCLGKWIKRKEKQWENNIRNS